MVRYLRPPWIVSKVINPLVLRLGTAATLTVPTGDSGRSQRLPVNVLEIDGRRYLVAVRGETHWVRNLRAAAECELRSRGWVRRFGVTEVPLADRGPLIAAYRARWGSKTGRFFAEPPDPADLPVFELLAKP